jgi:hypothetical protein
MEKNDLDEFHQALGRALAEWQYVEIALFEILLYFIQPITPSRISPIFYSHHTFRGKTRMIKGAGKAFFEENFSGRKPDKKKELHRFIKQLNSLLTACEKASVKRNDLAHYMVNYDGDKPLLAHPHADLRLSNAPPKSIEDINSISVEFFHLGNQVFVFAEALWRNRLPKEQ